MTISEAENAALEGVLGALTPADVVESFLVVLALVVAEEAFLFLTFGADHRNWIHAGVHHLLTVWTGVSHARRAIRRAHAAALLVVAFGAVGVPEESPLAAVLALDVVSITSS